MRILDTSVAKGGVGVRKGLLYDSSALSMSHHKSTRRLYLVSGMVVSAANRALNQRDRGILTAQTP
ncbi:MAG: hypothetical protein V3U65_10165 [Granulosicoccaceae bacterium]